MKTAHCRDCGTAQPLDEAGCCPAGHEIAASPPEGEPEPWVLELDDLLAASPNGAPDHHGEAPGAHDGDTPGPDDESLDPDMALLEAAMAQLDGSASSADDPDTAPAPDADLPGRGGGSDDGRTRGDDATTGSMSREAMISALPEAPRPRSTRGGEDEGDTPAPPGAGPSGDHGQDHDPEDRAEAGEDGGPSIDPANFTAGGDRVEPGGRSRSTRRLLPFRR